MKRSCRLKETSRAKSIWHEEKQQDCDLSVQDPSAQAQSKQTAQEINKHVSHGYNKDSENQRSERLQQIRNGDGGCHGHTSARDFNHREGDKQELYLLAEGIRYTEHELRNGSSHHDVDLNVNSLKQTVSMMMKRFTEQITDVSCGNTAALVGIEQFF